MHARRPPAVEFKGDFCFVAQSDVPNLLLEANADFGLASSLSVRHIDAAALERKIEVEIGLVQNHGALEDRVRRDSCQVRKERQTHVSVTSD